MSHVRIQENYHNRGTTQHLFCPDCAASGTLLLVKFAINSGVITLGFECVICGERSTYENTLSPPESFSMNLSYPFINHELQEKTDSAESQAPQAP